MIEDMNQWKTSLNAKIRNFIILLLVGIFLLPMGWIYTSFRVAEYRYDSIEALPYNDVWLLLGTSRYTSEGMENLFFTTRIEAAKLLYEKKKIKHILVSGDNSLVKYNEPESMRQALVKAGIPDSTITLDYAWLRTLDSVLRARDIFGLDTYTIISQTFHTERALYLARENGIDAIGFNAADISLRTGLRVYIREFAARWVAIFDVLISRDARILGKKEYIILDTKNN